MIVAAFVLGLLAGTGLGVHNGRDLGGSISGIIGRGGRIAVFFGLFKRTGLFMAALFASLYFGNWALAGVGLGYLAGFSVTIARKVRSDVR